MTLIATTHDLTTLCHRLAAHPYITVDTEFLRETTFWPRLCVVQLASEDEAVAVDVLADGIDLAPLFALMADPRVVKVFHAARQDVEIFWNLAKLVPMPLFDTQVAAMVCGFGDQISYSDLVQTVTKVHLDKSSALHRLVAPASQRGAGRLRHRRRHASARHLQVPAGQARCVLARRLAVGRDGNADRDRDLRAASRPRLGALPQPRPQAARSRGTDGTRRLARGGGAEPRRAALAHPEGRHHDRGGAGRPEIRRGARRAARLPERHGALEGRRRHPRGGHPRPSRATRRRCRRSTATGARPAAARRSSCSRCCCGR